MLKCLQNKINIFTYTTGYINILYIKGFSIVILFSVYIPHSELMTGPWNSILEKNQVQVGNPVCPVINNMLNTELSRGTYFQNNTFPHPLESNSVKIHDSVHTNLLVSFQHSGLFATSASHSCHAICVPKASLFVAFFCSSTSYRIQTKEPKRVGAGNKAMDA